MRQILLTAAAAVLAGGIATGAVLSQAQPAQAPAGPAEGPSPHGMAEGPSPHGIAEGPSPHGMAGAGMMGGGPTGGWHRRDRDRAFNPRDFALVYRQEDRQLVPGDVQKVVEGFLLWRGNHSWKVTNVGATADGPIGFSLATPEGSVVATFTMDPHTGKVVRVG